MLKIAIATALAACAAAPLALAAPRAGAQQDQQQHQHQQHQHQQRPAKTDSSVPSVNGPVQVFILMGQSNMLGMGKIAGDVNGTLQFAVHNESKYQYLLNQSTGEWATSETVRNVLIMGSGNASFEQSQLLHNEFMTVTGNTVGPELGIGWTLANYTSEPIMLLKACIGDRALGWGACVLQCGGDVLVRLGAFHPLRTRRCTQPTVRHPMRVCFTAFGQQHLC